MKTLKIPRCTNLSFAECVYLQAIAVLGGERISTDKNGNYVSPQRKLSPETLEDDIELAVSTLSEREQAILHDRFVEQLPFYKIGERYGLSGRVVIDLYHQAFRELRRPSRLQYIDGSYATNWQGSPQPTPTKPTLDPNRLALIDDTELSTRTRNTLGRAGLQIIDDLMALFSDDFESGWESLFAIRGIGVTSAAEIIAYLVDLDLLPPNIWSYCPKKYSI